MAGFEGERCGICMDMIVDRSLLDCCQNWFCFECIYNWSSIMNLCPLCQREFQLITCVPVNDSGESSKVDEVSLSGDEDWCVEEETDALSSPSHYIDENVYGRISMYDNVKIVQRMKSEEKLKALDVYV